MEDQSYPLLTEEQLVTKRDRLRQRLDELTANPGRSLGVCQLLADLDQEVEQVMEELLQRARSRHPSSGGPSAWLR